MPRLLCSSTTAVAVLFGAFVTASAEEPRAAEKPQAESQTAEAAIHLRVHGELRDGVVAIGGETTGTTVTAQNMTFELVLSPELKRLAAKHRGEPVLVEGPLRVKQGVEIPTRLLLQAESLRYGRPDPHEKPHAQITLRGKLQTGLAAIGGETTGTQVSAQGTTWELDLSGKKNLAEKAERLDGQQVIAKGRLTKVAGVERGDRYVVKTTRLEEVPR